jgi:hypothetical protein
MNKELTKTLKRQRATAAVEPIHANLPPVQAYVKYISDLTGVPHRAVTVPEGTAAHGMGFRFVSVSAHELDYYVENGATLAD